jgi:hypothetical protein
MTLQREKEIQVDVLKQGELGLSLEWTAVGRTKAKAQRGF